MGSSLKTLNKSETYQQVINKPETYQQVINEPATYSSEPPDYVDNPQHSKTEQIDNFIVMPEPFDFTSIPNQSPENIYQKALTYHKSDSNIYFLLLIASADRDYVPAQQLLSYEYINDMLKIQNYNVSLPLFDLDKEFAYSCYCLGKNYEKGFCVEKNINTAISFYEKAVNKNLCHAIYDLAEIYRNQQNYQKAYELHMMAFEQGYAHSINAIGIMYNNGIYVQKDNNKAIELYLKAIEKDFPCAMHNLAHLYLYDKEYQNYQQAFKYASMSKNRYYKSVHLLGIMYRDGKGTEQNSKKAFDLLSAAASWGISESMVAVGYMYYSGQHIYKNYDKAFEWFSKAADNGTNAMHMMGIMYYHGQGTEQNYRKALEIFQKLADAGEKSSIRALGCMYANGHGIERNYDKAIELIKTAMEMGHKTAFNDLCDLYRHVYTTGYPLQANPQRSIDNERSLVGYRQEDIVKYFISIGHPEKLNYVCGFDNFTIEMLQRKFILEKEFEELQLKYNELIGVDINISGK